MTDISVTSTPFQVEKRAWLLGPHGTDPGTTPPVTLDVSTFTAAAHYPNGYLLSGIVIAPITATPGLFGPYDDTALDGRQVAFGLLFSSVKVPNLLDLTKDVGGAALVHGFVRRSKLPIANGAAGRGFLDTPAEADLRLIHFA